MIGADARQILAHTPACSARDRSAPERPRTVAWLLGAVTSQLNVVSFTFIATTAVLALCLVAASCTTAYNGRTVCNLSEAVVALQGGGGGSGGARTRARPRVVAGSDSDGQQPSGDKAAQRSWAGSAAPNTSPTAAADTSMASWGRPPKTH